MEKRNRIRSDNREYEMEMQTERGKNYNLEKGMREVDFEMKES